MKTEKELFDALQAMIEGRHTLRVPPNEDKDEDLVLSAAITELITLRRENEDLKAKLETACEIVCAVKSSEFEGLSCEDTQGMNWFDARDELLSTTVLGASTRLRDKHYRECEEITRAEAKEVVLDRDTVLHILSAIARARESK